MSNRTPVAAVRPLPASQVLYERHGHQRRGRRASPAASDPTANHLAGILNDAADAAEYLHALRPEYWEATGILGHPEIASEVVSAARADLRDRRARLGRRDGVARAQIELEEQRLERAVALLAVAHNLHLVTGG